MSHNPIKPSQALPVSPQPQVLAQLTFTVAQNQEGVIGVFAEGTPTCEMFTAEIAEATSRVSAELIKQAKAQFQQMLQAQSLKLQPYSQADMPPEPKIK